MTTAEVQNPKWELQNKLASVRQQGESTKNVQERDKDRKWKVTRHMRV